MRPKQWFLVRFINGRPEIISTFFDVRDEALECYNRQEKIGEVAVCETVYG